MLLSFLSKRTFLMFLHDGCKICDRIEVRWNSWPSVRSISNQAFPHLEMVELFFHFFTTELIIKLHKKESNICVQLTWYVKSALNKGNLKQSNKNIFSSKELYGHSFLNEISSFPQKLLLL